MELAPGTVVDAIQSDDMTAEQRQELLKQYNLDKPMIFRYGLYMLNFFQGNLGVSQVNKQDVWDIFMTRLPNTLILSFSSLIIGAAVSIPLGIFAARRAGSLADNAVTVFSLAGMSMPIFWLGLLMLLLFSYKLGWLPGGGNKEGFRSIILPAICGSLGMIANTARQTRSNMLEVLNADFLRTARAKGVPESVVIRKHALGNAWIPILTTIGIGLAAQLAGSVVIESVFAWPGIGRLAVEAVAARDVSLVSGVVIMTSILYVLVQLVVDLLYAFVDPRIKAQYIKYAKRRKRVI
jgi:peptide/nickel transport system permease protein